MRSYLLIFQHNLLWLCLICIRRNDLANSSILRNNLLIFVHWHTYKRIVWLETVKFWGNKLISYWVIRLDSDKISNYVPKLYNTHTIHTFKLTLVCTCFTQFYYNCNSYNIKGSTDMCLKNFTIFKKNIRLFLCQWAQLLNAIEKS